MEGEGANVLDSARSHLTDSTMNSDAWGDLASGKLKRGKEKSVTVDSSLNKPTAERGNDFGDMVYDLEEGGIDDESGIECPVCGLASQVYKCKKCYDVGYCSRRCQQDDYHKHRLVCIVKTKEEIEELKRANRENEERIEREMKAQRELEEKERRSRIRRLTGGIRRRRGRFGWARGRD